MNYELHLGDCLEVMRTLPANSVQTCVTSPPYYGLRDYGHGGQIGLEETPEAYVAKLVEVFREVRRLLREDGTLWLNLASSYNGSGGAGGDYGPGGLKEGQPRYPGRSLSNFKPKDMIPIPWMVAMALQADGWYLRCDIIWHKPNPMPESVTDRPTKAHEYIFLLSKSASYFYDAEAIREPQSESTLTRFAEGNAPRKPHAGRKYEMTEDGRNRHDRLMNPGNSTGSAGILSGGRNRRSVWTVTTKPYAGAHFATFPPDLIEPCILAGTSAHGACAKCGAPWERVVERTDQPDLSAKGSRFDIGKTGMNGMGRVQNGERMLEMATGQWQPTCLCGCTDVTPCTVLDPFAGSGTTLAVALKHGRRGIGIELNESYIELAHRRITQSQPMLLEVIS